MSRFAGCVYLESWSRRTQVTQIEEIGADQSTEGTVDWAKDAENERKPLLSIRLIKECLIAFGPRG